jgi:D-2-hydroxyacid dehydrogenase (NADP+)
VVDAYGGRMVGVFVSDAVWDAVGDRLMAAAPDLERIRFVPGERVSDADAARVEVAFLSMDMWPQWTPSYMKVCIEAPSLRWLHSGSAGVDHPVFRMMIDRGTRLTNSSGASGRSIAHHVVMSLLALRRDLPQFLRDQAEQQWRTRDVGDVEDTVVGMLGMGPIGTESARLAQEFGMRVIGMRRTVSGDEPCETWTLDRLHELLPRLDALVLALPLAPATRQLIGATELALLPAGAHLVNVGRGELIDEAALIAALRSGHVGAASLDVTEIEPLPADSPLWSMPNVIVTPHSSGSTASTRRRAAEYFADEFEHYVRNEPFDREVT